jgi:tRNA(adenine34) deaminase
VSQDQAESVDSDEAAMRLAVAEAERALEHADVPVGAIALRNGVVIGRRHNERELRKDPTAHAELLLLRDVAQAQSDWRLGEVTIVVTLEPCAMCAGAMVNARLGRLVFGALDPKAGAVASLYQLCHDERLNHEVAVTGGVLAAQCGELLISFFAERRGQRPRG